MRVGLTVSAGQLAEAADDIIRETLTELTAAVGEETRGLEVDLEQITRLSVKGKLWRAWKSQSFPRGGGPAREPRGQVTINGGRRSIGAMTFFTQEGRIVAGGGGYLAIPTAAAGSRGRSRNLTPGEWERRNGARLRFVYRKGRPSLLVLDDAVLSGKSQVGRRNSERRRASGRGNATVIIFVLIPFLAFSPRFSIQPLIDRREKMLADTINRRLGA